MITYHGQKRAKKRFGIGYEQAENLFEEAKKYGKYAEDYVYRSDEYDYLLSREHHKGNRAVAYEGVCYIFSGDVCITMFNLPLWFENHKHYEGKEKVRNLKTYMRHYGNWEEEADAA